MNDRVVNSEDPADPLNYVTFDGFAQGAPRVYTTDALVRMWNRAHPQNPVRQIGSEVAPQPRSEPAALRRSAYSPTVTRVFAAVQLVGGGVELILGGGALLAPEPTGATKVLGTVVLVHGMDTVSSAIATIITGDRMATFTEQGATAIAEEAGASPVTAERIGVVTDVVVGVGGTFGIGALTRAPSASGQLVHLTSRTGAEGIATSGTLGLGRSTVYAGPQSLANSRGWWIAARTGLQPAQASEVILVPAAANRAFAMVRPIGPITTWQRLNGTVFSAGAGSFNMATGVFTRTGPASNQLLIYGLDAGIMATMRAAPPLIESAAGNRLRPQTIYNRMTEPAR